MVGEINNDSNPGKNKDKKDPGVIKEG